MYVVAVAVVAVGGGTLMAFWHQTLDKWKSWCSGVKYFDFTEAILFDSL